MSASDHFFRPDLDKIPGLFKIGGGFYLNPKDLIDEFDVRVTPNENQAQSLISALCGPDADLIPPILVYKREVKDALGRQYVLVDGRTRRDAHLRLGKIAIKAQEIRNVGYLALSRIAMSANGYGAAATTSTMDLKKALGSAVLCLLSKDKFDYNIKEAAAAVKKEYLKFATTKELQRALSNELMEIVRDRDKSQARLALQYSTGEGSSFTIDEICELFRVTKETIAEVGRSNKHVRKDSPPQEEFHRKVKALSLAFGNGIKGLSTRIVNMIGVELTAEEGIKLYTVTEKRLLRSSTDYNRCYNCVAIKANDADPSLNLELKPEPTPSNRRKTKPIGPVDGKLPSSRSRRVSRAKASRSKASK